MSCRTKKSVVLLSGGLDSATVLAIAKSEGYEFYALSFSYGQRHVWELEAAKRVAASIGVAEHRIAAIDLRAFGGSALTADIAVPKGRATGEMAHGIPITYVPARNTIFLSFALAWAEVLGASDIFLGVNALDYSGYPDCRPEFIEAFEKMANLATKAGVEGRQQLKIHTPLIAITKAEIIAQGNRTGRGLRADEQLLRSFGNRRTMRSMRFVPSAAKGFPRKRHRRSAYKLLALSRQLSALMVMRNDSTAANHSRMEEKLKADSRVPRRFAFETWDSTNLNSPRPAFLVNVKLTTWAFARELGADS